MGWKLTWARLQKDLVSQSEDLGFPHQSSGEPLNGQSDGSDVIRCSFQGMYPHNSVERPGWRQARTRAIRAPVPPLSPRDSLTPGSSKHLATHIVLCHTTSLCLCPYLCLEYPPPPPLFIFLANPPLEPSSNPPSSVKPFLFPLSVQNQLFLPICSHGPSQIPRPRQTITLPR